eukprot:1962069-Rhodomonas_salina.1
MATCAHAYFICRAETVDPLPNSHAHPIGPQAAVLFRHQVYNFSAIVVFCKLLHVTASARRGNSGSFQLTTERQAVGDLVTAIVATNSRWHKLVSSCTGLVNCHGSPGRNSYPGNGEFALFKSPQAAGRCATASGLYPGASGFQVFAGRGVNSSKANYGGGVLEPPGPGTPGPGPAGTPSLTTVQ